METVDRKLCNGCLPYHEYLKGIKFRGLVDDSDFAGTNFRGNKRFKNFADQIF